MKRIAYALLPALAFLSLPSAPGIAQEQSLKSAIIGTWVLEKSVQRRSDGSETNAWGTSLTGHVVYGPDGAYTQVIIGTKDPSMKPSDVREPDAPIVVLIGSYRVDPDDKTVHVKVARGGNSVRDGAEFADTVAVKDDEMNITGAKRTDAKGSFSPVQTLHRFKL